MTESVQDAPATKRQSPLRRLVLSVVAAILLAAAVYFFLEYRRLRAEYDRAEAAEIGVIDADLSKPGRYSVKVTGRYRLAHGMSLVLRVDPSPTGERPTREWFADVKATVRLVDFDGQATKPMATDPSRISVYGEEVHLDGFGGGPHEFSYELELQEGIPKLAGLRQRLYAKNSLCGLEANAYRVAAAFAIVASIAAAWILRAVLKQAGLKPE